MPTKKKSSTVRARTKARIVVNLFGGDRQPVTEGFKSLLRVTDGNQKQLVVRSVTGNGFNLIVPFNDNTFDNYTVLVSAKDHVDAGFFPVTVEADFVQTVDLMLLHDDATYKFATWNSIKQSSEVISDSLRRGIDESEAEHLFSNLVENKPAAASLLNLTTAMSQVHLRVGTPLHYFKQILWDGSLGPDRFFG